MHPNYNKQLHETSVSVNSADVGKILEIKERNVLLMNPTVMGFGPTPAINSNGNNSISCTCHNQDCSQDLYLTVADHFKIKRGATYPRFWD
jgi:hypothetical protein